MISKLVLTTLNLGHSDLKQTAFPEKTALEDYRQFGRRSKVDSAQAWGPAVRRCVHSTRAPLF